MKSAVVGVGYLGRFHAQKHQQLTQSKFKNQIEFAGVFDVDPAQAKKVADELGVPVFKTFQEVLNQVQIVTLATTTASHFELSQSLLQNKIHSLIEKPLAMEWAQGEELVNLAKKNKVTLMVGHSERFSFAFENYQKKINRPQSLQFYRHAPFLNRGLDVDVVLDLSVHDIDLLLSLYPHQPIELLSCVGGKVKTSKWDWVQAFLKVKDGPQVLISTSRVSAQMQRELWAYENQMHKRIHFQTGLQEVIRKDNSEILKEDFGRRDHLLAETENFFDAVLGASAARITGENAVQALQWVAKIRNALEG